MISIIVPVYNAENYISRCYVSIVNQDFADWELIFINDGSIDKSKQICSELASKDQRITLINQDNQGASFARRVGIEHAKGDYLVFIDCDDIVESNYLSSLYQTITTMQTNIAVCGITKHQEEEHPIIPKPTKPIILDEAELMSRFFRYEFWGYVDKIYKKNVFNDIYFPSYTINEDYVVMLQLFNKERKIAYVDAPLYHYIIHPNSLSHQKISKRAFDEFYNKIWAYEYCKKTLPSYIKQAEAQVAESCIKLIRMVTNNPSGKIYRKEGCEMKSFLKRHMFSILMNNHLLLGLKFYAIKYALI